MRGPRGLRCGCHAIVSLGLRQWLVGHGPLGAAIGASIGLEIGLAEKLFGVESSENHAKHLVKQLYWINIDTLMGNQIVAIRTAEVHPHVSVALCDLHTEDADALFGTNRDRKMPLWAMTTTVGLGMA